jgi:hypothetical protein
VGSGNQTWELAPREPGWLFLAQIKHAANEHQISTAAAAAAVNVWCTDADPAMMVNYLITRDSPAHLFLGPECKNITNVIVSDRLNSQTYSLKVFLKEIDFH